nr:hypothetical protein [Myxococcota bacterium]
DFDGATCGTLGHDGGTLSCSATCAIVETMCTDCGDGMAEGTEECDGADLSGESCTTVPGGFSGGTLSCSAACGFDTAACTL